MLESEVFEAFEVFSLLADLLRNVDLFLIAWVSWDASLEPIVTNLPFWCRSWNSRRDEMKNVDVLHSYVPRI